MKDFLPNFTFGFLMAQLFPGAVTVVCLTCPYVAFTGNNSIALSSLMNLFERVGDVWFGSTRNAVVFLFLSTATGMFVHGLNWMILGWETQRKDAAGTPICDTEGNPDSIGLRELAFHSQALWLQLLLAPINIAQEVVRLLRAPQLKWILMEENAPSINPASMPIFNWLQDFYLYFGQFYVHMAYSLLIGLLSLTSAFLIMGFTRYRVGLLLFLYLLIGLFYLMGRTQLSSLFKNESILLAASTQPKGPMEIELRNKL